MNLPLDKQLTDFLREVRRAAPDQKVYLVGGAVRDLVLERKVKDLDFVVAAGSVQLAKQVKRKFEGVWYTLDDEHQTARVILGQGQQAELVLDFTAFIGGSLEEDLRQRDFTINAMAIDLDNLDEVLDPLHGQEHLRTRRLTLCNPRSLLSDPLRVLRAVRMVRAFDLVTTSENIEQLRIATKDLKRISGERIRDELLKCLAVPNLVKTFDLLREFGILDQLQERVFKVEQPEIFTTDIVRRRLSILEDLLAVIDGVDSVSHFQTSETIFPFPPDIQIGLRQHLNESLQGGRTRQQLLILFAFFFNRLDDFPAGSDKNIEFTCPKLAEGLSSAFLLGQKEQKHLELVCVGYKRILSMPPDVGTIQLYNFFKETGSSGLESAILHISEQLTSPMPNGVLTELSHKIIHAWFYDYDSIIDPPRLLSGDDLQRELHLKPGPELGFFLESVREAQVVGEVKNREEAIALVLCLIKEGKKHVR